MERCRAHVCWRMRTGNVLSVTDLASDPDSTSQRCSVSAPTTPPRPRPPPQTGPIGRMRLFRPAPLDESSIARRMGRMGSVQPTEGSRAILLAAVVNQLDGGIG